MWLGTLHFPRTPFLDRLRTAPVGGDCGSYACPGSRYNQAPRSVATQQASGAAVSTLLKLMVDGTTPASTRARAAECVLNHAAKAIELEDIEARVAELERAAEASKSTGER